MKFKKKPVVIEAMVFNYPPSAELLSWLGDSYSGVSKQRHPGAVGELEIKTLEDGHDGRVKHVASEGDYIIKGFKGEFYPCKPDIFHATYEAL